MSSLTYLKGDATNPDKSNAPKNSKHYILHICNDKGGWGAGFVLAISKKWFQPEIEYRRGIFDKNLKLGDYQTIEVEPNLFVVNLIAQEGYGSMNRPPIRYWALRKALKAFAWNEGIGSSGFIRVLHMPRMGCGLAGGHWDEIESCLEDNFAGNIPMFVYDFEP